MSDNEKKIKEGKTLFERHPRPWTLHSIDDTEATVSDFNDYELGFSVNSAEGKEVVLLMFNEDLTISQAQELVNLVNNYQQGEQK